MTDLSRLSDRAAEILDELLGQMPRRRRWRYAEINRGQDGDWLRVQGDESKDALFEALTPVAALAAITALKAVAGLRVDAPVPQHARLRRVDGTLRIHCCPQWDGEVVALHWADE